MNEVTKQVPSIDAMITELHDRSLFETAVYGDYISDLRAGSLANPTAPVEVVPHVSFFAMSSPSSGDYKLGNLNYAWYGYKMGKAHAAQEDAEVVKLLNDKE